MKTIGYSGTALEKKLGIKNNFKIKLVNQPENYFDLFENLPADIKILKDQKTKKDFIHYFSKSADQLKRDITLLRNQIEPNGMIWISWPKKSAKIETDLDENIIRNIALDNGLVDVKVCSVDEIWSGLKLVIRLKDRK
jgi:hypothetical protein